MSALPDHVIHYVNKQDLSKLRSVYKDLKNKVSRVHKGLNIKVPECLKDKTNCTAKRLLEMIEGPKKEILRLDFTHTEDKYIYQSVSFLLLCLEKIKNLEFLRKICFAGLSCTHELNFEDVSLTQIKELRCESLTVKNLNFLQHCNAKNLECLELIKVNITDTSFVSILKHCKNLKELTIDLILMEHGKEFVKDLKKLEILKLNNWRVYDRMKIMKTLVNDLVSSIKVVHLLNKDLSTWNTYSIYPAVKENDFSLEVLLQ